MSRTNAQLREDALAIWHAGLEAVRSERLVEQAVRVADGALHVVDAEIPLGQLDRILVVGGGKAGAGMAAGLEAALAGVSDQIELDGWLNVPDDCLRPLQHIHLHGARPAGRNEPTEAGVAGVEQILQRVAHCGPRDLCLCLISGGGSALLPAPVEGITLQDKLAVTRFLSDQGANIEQMNTVRKQLSRFKGGGLARAHQLAHPEAPGRLMTLVISDVLGDPLDVIASGPTVANSTSAQDALDVLNAIGFPPAPAGPRIRQFLETARVSSQPRVLTDQARASQDVFIIGNNATAVDAAGLEAERRGYRHAMNAASDLEGLAEDVGRHLARMADRMRSTTGPDCLITGGEPVVELAAPEERGLGGRNQQLALAALQQLQQTRRQVDDVCLLSAGTDGEDGPTDAAGALIDAEIAERARSLGLDEAAYLRRNDAYHFFEPVQGLILTGPTHTNVCDVRVCCVKQ